MKTTEENQRIAMIDELIESDLRCDDHGSGIVRNVLTYGFKGYENMQTKELFDEMKLRGLSL